METLGCEGGGVGVVVELVVELKLEDDGDGNELDGVEVISIEEEVDDATPMTVTVEAASEH